ncbi:MAG: hypothetical protein DHS20C15_14680 [Planctomycetota bacterium]|nr:MAG: hypothetical protein DHS20C15_14680 [Planctomycetota bacterium]
MLISALLLGSLLTPAPQTDGLAEARSALKEGRVDVAERLLNELASADEQHLEARLLLSELLMQRPTPNPNRVLELLDPWDSSTEARALVALGEAYESIARDLQTQRASIDDVGYFLGEALSHYERAASFAEPGDTEGLTKAGYLALYEFSDWNKTVELADAALSVDKRNAEARLMRGCARLYAYVEAKQGDDEAATTAVWQSAVDDLQFAGEKLGEARGDAWWQLAWLYEDASEPVLAVESAVLHMQRTPDMDISRVYGLAKRYANENEFGASRAALLALIEHDEAELTRWVAAEADPTAVAVRLGYSVGSDVASGNLATAITVLEPLLAVQPADADIWNNFGLLNRDRGVQLEQAGDTEEAQRHYVNSYNAYEKSIEFAPENPQMLNDTALVMQYHVRTDLDRARELYREAIKHATLRIEAGDTLPELKIALRDATNNLGILGG